MCCTEKTEFDIRRRDVERGCRFEPFYPVGEPENEKFAVEKNAFCAIKCNFEACGEADVVEVDDVELEIQAVGFPRNRVVRKFQVYPFFEACSDTQKGETDRKFKTESPFFFRSCK